MVSKLIINWFLTKESLFVNSAAYATWQKRSTSERNALESLAKEWEAKIGAVRSLHGVISRMTTQRIWLMAGLVTFVLIALCSMVGTWKVGMFGGALGVGIPFVLQITKFSSSKLRANMSERDRLLAEVRQISRTFREFLAWFETLQVHLGLNEDTLLNITDPAVLGEKAEQAILSKNEIVVFRARAYAEALNCGDVVETREIIRKAYELQPQPQVSPAQKVRIDLLRQALYDSTESHSWLLDQGLTTQTLPDVRAIAEENQQSATRHSSLAWRHSGVQAEGSLAGV